MISHCVPKHESPSATIGLMVPLGHIGSVVAPVGDRARPRGFGGSGGGHAAGETGSQASPLLYRVFRS